MPENEEMTLGKYGRLRLNHLKNHQRGLYSSLRISGGLEDHLREIDETATRMVENIVQRMAEADGTNEELKARDQMRWVGLMNSYRHSAEETVLQDLIYA